MAKITYQNKTNEQAVVDRTKQVTAEDLNEIKEVVNGHDDEVDELQNKTQAFGINGELSDDLNANGKKIVNLGVSDIIIDERDAPNNKMVYDILLRVKGLPYNINKFNQFMEIDSLDGGYLIVSGNTLKNSFLKYNFGIDDSLNPNNVSKAKVIIKENDTGIASDNCPFMIVTNYNIGIGSAISMYKCSINQNAIIGAWIDKTPYSDETYIGIQWMDASGNVLQNAFGLFTTLNLDDTWQATYNNILHKIVIDEINGNYAHIKMNISDAYPSAAYLRFFVFNGKSAAGEEYKLINLNILEGVDEIDNYALYTISDYYKLNANKIAIVNSELTDEKEEKRILSVKGFINLVSEIDNGGSSQYIIANADSVISFINNDSTTPPELSGVSKIMVATAPSTSAYFNWNFRFDSKGRKWVAGVWLNKEDYNGGSLRMHISYSNLDGSNNVFSYQDIAYNDLKTGTSGILIIDGHESSFEIIDEYGDWIYVIFKQVENGSISPEKTLTRIIPYKTGGTVANYGYKVFHPALNLYGVNINPRVQEYSIKQSQLEVAKLLTPFSKMVLPDYIEMNLGDTIQIFKFALMDSWNPRFYNIQGISDKQDGINFVGKDYARYFEYTADDSTNFNITFKAYTNDRLLIDEKTIEIRISNKTTQPATNTRVMFMGDSLTFYNRISDEFYRVLTSNDTAFTQSDNTSPNTLVMPAGKSFGNIELIGTQKNNYLGWTGQTFHEGYSGWTWQNFIQSGSPFWNSSTSQLDFNKYLTDNGFTGIDVIYIGLGWNDITKSMGFNRDTTQIIENAKTFLRALHTQLPDVKVYLWTENFSGVNGGEATNGYGSNETTDVQEWRIRLSRLFESYYQLVNDPEFNQYCYLIGSHIMIDSEKMMKETSKTINTRVTDTEYVGIDGVHPSDGGFMQIADAIIKSFIYNFCQ